MRLLQKVLTFFSLVLNGLLRQYLFVVACLIVLLALFSVVETRLEALAAEGSEAEAERARQATLEELGETQMVHVQGGTFRMGCTAEQGECYFAEKPVHEVQVSDFEIGQYEVTQEVWEAVMGENPSDFDGCPECPVENVSWEDVQVFLEELKARLGKEYRLPTEAEWEYAARGGRQSQGYKYAGSDNRDAVAWHDGNSGDKTHRVGEKRPNELGLYDMSGNVWEWVADCWHDSYEGAPSDGGAWASGECSRRVLRGGSWFIDPWYLRSANRVGYPAGDRHYVIGVRLARTLTP